LDGNEHAAGAASAQRRDGRRRPFTAALNSQLARTQEPLLRAHRLAIPDNPDLIDELVNLRIVEPATGQSRIEHTPRTPQRPSHRRRPRADHLLNKPARRRAELIA
jgi:hypothetical protein